MYSLTEFIDREKALIDCEKKAINKLVDYLNELDANFEQTNQNNQLNNNNNNEINDDLKIRHAINDSDYKPKNENSLIDSQLEKNKRLIDSKYDDNEYTITHITPRNRLLATHSSRVRAEKYREDLRKQIEDNKRRKAEELERIKRQDMELERKIEDQRRQIMIDYENEQKHVRKKTDAIIKRQEMINIIQDQRNDIFPVKSRHPFLRSPSYLLHEYRATTRTPLVQKLNSAKRSLDKTLLIHSKDNLEGSAAHSSVHLPEHESENTEHIKNGSGDRDTSNLSNTANNTQFESDKRILGKLAEVRQMMANDHLKMIQQLQAQQLKQET